MNFVLFVIILIISFYAVRIGAIAFELTGLEWSLAKFQALSCFTSTGFTTKEAELVTGNRQRRKIAGALMVLGNAGLITLIATFANSLRTGVIFLAYRIPFVEQYIPREFKPWVKLVILIIAAYLVYRFFTHSKIVKRVLSFIKNHIIKKELIKQVSFEELLVATGGYGVSSIEIVEGNPLIDKSIVESNLRQHDITVLAIERDTETIPNPKADMKIHLGDRLVCFGKLGEMKKRLTVKEEKEVSGY